MLDLRGGRPRCDRRGAQSTGSSIRIRICRTGRTGAFAPIHLRDPDGNLIELNSPLLASQWSSEDEDYTDSGQAGDSGSVIGDTDLVQ